METLSVLLCRFVMWYEAVAKDGSRSIGIAVSSNGISDWKRRDRQAPFTPLSALSAQHMHPVAVVQNEYVLAGLQQVTGSAHMGIGDSHAVNIACARHCICALYSVTVTLYWDTCVC